MNRNIVEINTNAGFMQLFEYLALRFLYLIQSQANDIKMPTGLSTRILPRSGKGEMGQSFIVGTSNLPPAGHKGVDPFGLAETESRLNIGQAIVIAQLNLLIVPRAGARLSKEFLPTGNAM